MNVASENTAFVHMLRSEAPQYGIELTEETVARLDQYYALVQHWNPRLHLVAPCSPEEFATRHVLESLMAPRYVTQEAKIVDIGSGGGLPIIPCLSARPDLSATLIEASAKKVVFLREAINRIKLDADVRAERFESTPPPAAQFLTCRALERFTEMLPVLMEWAPDGSTLLLFGGEAIEVQLRILDRQFEMVRMPNSEGRYLFIVAPKTS